MNMDSIEAIKLFGSRHRYKVCTGARYLGGFIEYDNSKRDWLKKRTKTWERHIFKIHKTTGRFPTESYFVVSFLIQSKRIFLQRVTKKWETHLRECRRRFRWKITSPFIQKFKVSFTHHRNSNYNNIQQIRPEPPESRAVRER